MRYSYQLMTKSAIIAYFTNKVNNDVARRKIDPSKVPTDYVVRCILEDISNGYADSTIEKRCSKLLSLIAN